ncbi:MAG: hypothetical protein KJ621_02450, partial [Proteobacteria bacterium]|nr:hypothetical protein [Pseudomonadota bacterium]MBU1742673.1 hypothetical protein [Pseudomonadota bacterium]
MAQPESIAGRGRQLTKNYLAQPLGAFYADFTSRLLLYFLLAGLFFVEVLLALAVYKGPSILVSHMAFSTVYALHTALAFTL